MLCYASGVMLDYRTRDEDQLGKSILTWHRDNRDQQRRFPQSEALPLHLGWVDLCDYPKCG